MFMIKAKRNEVLPCIYTVQLGYTPLQHCCCHKCGYIAQRPPSGSVSVYTCGGGPGVLREVGAHCREVGARCRRWVLAAEVGAHYRKVGAHCREVGTTAEK